MKSQKKLSKNSIIFFLLLSLFASSVIFSQGKKSQPVNGKFLSQISELTNQQRKELRTIIKTDFYNGISRAGIRKDVISTLKKWGINVPKNLPVYRFEIMNHFANRSSKLLKKLTQKQRAKLRIKMKQLWLSGASGKKLHAKAKKMLKNWGYDIAKFKMNYPFNVNRIKKGMKAKNRRKFLRAAQGRIAAQRMMQKQFRFEKFAANIPGKLTDKQREELHEIIMKKRESNRKEIREIVRKKLLGWGIKIPKDFMNGNQPGNFRNFMRNMDKLSDNQRKEIRTLALNMWDNGDLRKDIKTAVQNKLHDFGINNTNTNKDN